MVLYFYLFAQNYQYLAIKLKRNTFIRKYESNAEVLKDARNSAGLTQQEPATKIGKKRERIAALEKGETDMQLSTFILISEAVGLKFVLTYWRKAFLRLRQKFPKMKNST